MQNQLINGLSTTLYLHVCPQCQREFFDLNGVQCCPACCYIWFHTVIPDEHPPQGTMANDGDGSVTVNITVPKGDKSPPMRPKPQPRRRQAGSYGGCLSVLWRRRGRTLLVTERRKRKPTQRPTHLPHKVRVKAGVVERMRRI